MQQQILGIPEQCFKYRDVTTQIYTEQDQATPVTKFTWDDNGINMYLEGAEYPMKGLTSAETMWALNLAKRIFVEATRFFGKWYFVPTYILFIFFPWKYKMKLLHQVIHSYCEVTWRNLSPFFLKTRYMTPLGQELEWVSYSFLNNLGISSALCSNFSEVFSAMVDYDTAYRYRIQDIFSEAKKEALLDNPRKEIKRLLAILKERDQECIYRKFKAIGFILRLMLLYPKIKRVFRIVVGEMNLRKMGYDEADKYWVCLRNDEYKFLGKTQKERSELIKGKSIPVLKPR